MTTNAKNINPNIFTEAAIRKLPFYNINVSLNVSYNHICRSTSYVK